MKSYGGLLLLIIFVMLTGACGHEDASFGNAHDIVAKRESSVAGSDNVKKKNIYKAHKIEDIPDDGYVDNQLIVRFKDDVEAGDSLLVHEELGAHVIKSFRVVENLQLVGLPEGVSVLEAIAFYNGRSEVQYAEPNYIVNSESEGQSVNQSTGRKVSRYATQSTEYGTGEEIIPNDPYFVEQYALKNDGSYKNGTPGADIKITHAWQISTGSPNIVVAVIDTGVDYNHPDLANNIWINKDELRDDGLDNDGNGYIDDFVGWDFIGDDLLDPIEDNDPMDDYWNHGTHVSGTIGALTDNKEGVAGVCWDVKIMALKALEGVDLDTVISALVGAVEYATENGANIINASWGWSDHRSNALFEAIEGALRKNILFITSAGNKRENIDYMDMYPQIYDLDNVIVVSASDQNDELASFTNYGAKVADVAAPGVDICSTISTSNGALLYDCGYSGTSMASPHVAGLAALLWSYYTHFDYVQIKSMIKEYVDVFDEEFQGKLSSKGRINAWKSMSALWGATNLTILSDMAGDVKLTWMDRATAETGYKVYRKEINGDFIEISDLGKDAEAFTDITSVANVTYSYTVKAYNSIGFSPESNSESITTVAPPVAPSSGGGGGCSISQVGKNNRTQYASYDILLITLPFIVFIMLKLVNKKSGKEKIK